jgi:hypothetical protein
MTWQADEACHGDVDLDGVALEVRMQADPLAGSPQAAASSACKFSLFCGSPLAPAQLAASSGWALRLTCRRLPESASKRSHYF